MFIYRIKQLALLLGDLISFAIGFGISISLRYFEIPAWELIERHLTPFLIVYLFWILTNFINGLYDLERLTNDRAFYRRFVETSVISLAISITFFYLFPDQKIAPKTILLANTILGYGLSALWRIFFQRVIGAKSLSNNVIFVGYTPEARELIEILKDKPEKGYNVRALIDPTKQVRSSDFNFDVYNSFNTIRPAITNHKAHIVIIAPHLQQNNEALRELYELLFWKVQLIDLTSFYESITGRIPPCTFSEGWFLQNLRNSKQPIYDRFRTIIDYVVALILGAFLLALLPFLALAIKINSPGPVFIKQKRVGQFGEIFWIYKLRSMYALSADGSAEVGNYEFEKWVAKKDDKRITAVGKFLRRSRLDELPQIFNVLKGDMSLIGPRAEWTECVKNYENSIPFYHLRHLVKPGITGWAQVFYPYGESVEDAKEKLQYDLFYIKNRDLGLDLAIVLKTLMVILSQQGR